MTTVLLFYCYIFTYSFFLCSYPSPPSLSPLSFSQFISPLEKWNVIFSPTHKLFHSVSLEDILYCFHNPFCLGRKHQISPIFWKEFIIFVDRNILFLNFSCYNYVGFLWSCHIDHMDIIIKQLGWCLHWYVYVSLS